MGGPLGGLHALVTGGGSGIGAACALTLTRHGATVTVLGRRADTPAAVDATGVAVADVTDAAALAASIAEAAATRGAIDILVNAAGAAEGAPFARADDSSLRPRAGGQPARGGERHPCRAARNDRTPTPPHRHHGFDRGIESLCPCHGPHGSEARGDRAAARAQEVAAKGITVNAICPGFTDTDLVTESVARIVATTGRDAAAARAELARHNPQGRLLRPAEVAAAVVSLCLPGASGINGQAIAVDGGET